MAKVENIGNVTLGCKRFGIARSTYYYLKSRAQRAPGKDSPGREKIEGSDLAIVTVVLEWTLRFPRLSYQRMGERLRTEGFKITNALVRKIWEGRNLRRWEDRYLWLEAEYKRQGRRLTTHQERILRQLRACGARVAV